LSGRGPNSHLCSTTPPTTTTTRIVGELDEEGQENLGLLGFDEAWKNLKADDS